MPARPYPAWYGAFDGDLDAESAYTHSTAEPAAGWAPFNGSSPWNTPIPADPTVAADSADVVAHMNALSGVDGPVDPYTGLGGTSEDYTHPVYYAHDGDPLKRIVAVANKTDPSIQYTAAENVPNGKRRASDSQLRVIRFPVEAESAQGSDGHLMIVTDSHSYELIEGGWVFDEAGSPGRYSCRCSAMFDLSGDGSSTSGHGVTAAGVSGLSGQIRVADLEAGQINHAIAMTVRWARYNDFVAPATGCATPDSANVTPGDPDDLLWPLTGSRFQLNMTEAAIDALSVPAWKKAILHAMRVYGLIFMDTTGNWSWGVQVESGAPDVAYGGTDRWVTFGDAQGWATDGAARIMPLKADVDWSLLRIVEV